MNIDEQNLIIKFLEPFSETITRLLKENLDEDVCKNISFEYESSSEIANPEELKEENIIYHTDYATGQTQGSLTALIPEELIASISDILTGGKGDKKSTGSITEIEINSTSSLLAKILKDVENVFKHSYNKDLAFSSKPSFIVKEMPEFKVNTENFVFDFLVNYKLRLNDDKYYDIKLLLNIEKILGLTIDLGLLKVNASIKKMSVSSLDLDTISDVKINVTAELGRARVPIKYALELVRGSLIELDTLNNSDIKVYANGVEFAYAQVVAVEDNFGLKITKIIPPKERLECIS